MSTTLTAAAVAKLRPGKSRCEIPDGGAPGLYLVIQPSGAKSWAMRFRRPSGKPAKMTMGPVDLSGRQAADEPALDTPLTLADARALAADIHRQRERGLDVVAEHKADKRRRHTEGKERAANTFGQAARDFIEGYKVKKTGKRPRRWREIGRVLGLNYSADGSAPTEIKGGLAQRWREKPIAEISRDDVDGVIDECRRSGIPGLQPRNDDASDARGRKMADALGAMFTKWIMKNRQLRKMVRENPCLQVDRPGAPAKRSRVLNTKPDVRNADELRWFWAATDGIGEPVGSVLKMLLLSGCRLNEIARMKRDELSDDTAMLRLPPERTKNNLEHHVPLSPLAREIMADVVRIDGCEFVFSTDGKTAVSAGSSKVKERLDAAMLTEARKERGASATIAPWQLRDLRRTVSTGMNGIGIAPHIVEAVLNHISGAKAGVAGTYNVEQYAAEKKAGLERWARHIASIVDKKPTKNVVEMRAAR